MSDARRYSATTGPAYRDARRPLEKDPDEIRAPHLIERWSKPSYMKLGVRQFEIWMICLEQLPVRGVPRILAFS